MIEGLLQKLDFSRNESSVYLAVLKHGKISPSRVSTLTGVNRTTTYGIARKLAKLGIVALDLGRKTHYIAALPPNNLHALIKKDELALAKKKSLVSDAVAELGPLTANLNYSVPRIQFIEEHDLNEHLYRRAEIWLRDAEHIDNITWGYRDHTLLENYTDWIDHYWKVAPKKHAVNLLSNRADIEKKLLGKYPNRKNKYWDKVQNFTVTMWVMGNYIVMVSTQQRPHYLIEIHDPVMAQNQRELFKGIWSELEDLKYD